MGTSLSDVADLFMSRVNDYRLTNIYQTSGSFIFSEYLEPYLMDSILEFDICTQDLTYTPTSGSVEGYFTEDLTYQHKSILSQIMVKYWLAKTVQDIPQMNNFVTDHDFRTFSAAQNLTAKTNYYNSKKEEISQMLLEYGYKINPWNEWRNQVFAK